MSEQTPPVRSEDAEARRNARIQADKEARVKIRIALRKAKRVDERAENGSGSNQT